MSIRAASQIVFLAAVLLGIPLGAGAAGVPASGDDFQIGRAHV